MRYVSGLAPSINYLASNELQPAAVIRSIRPVGGNGTNSGWAWQYPAHKQPKVSNDEQDTGGRRNRARSERRVVVRRLRQLNMLLELRSGIERRRRHNRDSDPVRHINIKA